MTTAAMKLRSSKRRISSVCRPTTRKSRKNYIETFKITKDKFSSMLFFFSRHFLIPPTVPVRQCRSVGRMEERDGQCRCTKYRYLFLELSVFDDAKETPNWNGVETDNIGASQRTLLFRPQKRQQQRRCLAATFGQRSAAPLPGSDVDFGIGTDTSFLSPLLSLLPGGDCFLLY